MLIHSVEVDSEVFRDCSLFVRLVGSVLGFSTKDSSLFILAILRFVSFSHPTL
jgi:hypothetical protein